MDNDTGKRGPENRITPKRTSSNSATNSSISPSQASDSVSQSSLDVNARQEYGLGKDQSAGGAASPSSKQPSQGPRTTNATSNTVAVADATNPTILQPPVTKETLGELDVNKIVHNSKLRHDINYDPELHFRPNLDGEKGRKKTITINHFWETFRQQLEAYSSDREQFERDIGDAKWCLPVTLETVREILETLVPQQDRASVDETFNVDLLMQQFRRGVADLEKLASWLSVLLKCHCAPMRDEWIDEVVRDFGNGNRNGDVTLLVKGLRQLLAVLEAMKLDVANHQIRCLRPLLIEDTVHFMQKFFLKKIELRRVDVDGSHEWFRRTTSFWGPPDAPGTTVHLEAVTWEFFRALLDLILPSKATEKVPHTFLFDEERLLKLRADIMDLINMEMCMELYRTLESESRRAAQGARDDTPQSITYSLSPSSGFSSPSDSGSGYSSPTVPSIRDFEEPKSPRQPAVAQRFPLRTLSTDQICSGTTSPSSSGSSSPCSSASSSASASESDLPTPLYLSQPASDTSAHVRASLRAILASCPNSDKWELLSSSLALQIVRATNTPFTRLPHYESYLATNLANTTSCVYLQAESRVVSQLLPTLKDLTERYATLTNLQMFEAATAPRNVLMVGNGPLVGVQAEIRDVATRIAHIGSLHWRVWAELVYLVDPRVKVADSESVAQGP